MLVVFPFLVCSNNAQNGSDGILDFVHKIPRFVLKYSGIREIRNLNAMHKSLFVNNVHQK